MGNRSAVLLASVLTLTACDEICIDGVCFEPDPDADVELALWLDWTTLPIATNNTSRVSAWRDRSIHTNDARVIEGRDIPLLTAGGTTVLHFHGVGYTMTVAQEEGDPLWSLEEDDYLVLMAVSLDCAPGEPDSQVHSLMNKRREDESPTRMAGFIVDAYNPEPDGYRWLSAIAHACDPLTPDCRSNVHYDDVMSCDTYQLVGIRRFTADGERRFEGRIDGVGLGSVPAGTPVEGGSVMTIGGRDADSLSMHARVAAVVAIKGNVDDAQACQLEQFLLERMVAAGLRDSAPSLGCTE